MADFSEALFMGLERFALLSIVGGASLEILFIIYIYNFIYNGWRGACYRMVILSV